MRRNIVHSIIPILAALANLTVIAHVVAAPATAQTPYPDINAPPSEYAHIPPYKHIPSSWMEMYRVVDRTGMWFTGANGIDCGIGDDSSFGCSGTIPGAPHGENEIAWFPGDALPRLYHTDKPRFASGKRQQVLTQFQILTYRGSTCAISQEARVYCFHEGVPNSQFMVGNLMAYRGSQALPVS